MSNKILSIIVRFTKFLQQGVRYRYLNVLPGIQISRNCFIAQDVKFALYPDGYSVGGKIRLGPNVRISNGVVLAPYGGMIVIDSNVFIGPYSVIYGHGNVFIGKDTLIAAHTVIIPANHRYELSHEPIVRQPISKKGIHIGRDVWVGSGVKILDGVTIGDGSVIGAGSVVTRNIAPYSIAMGAPAKVIKSR